MTYIEQITTWLKENWIITFFNIDQFRLIANLILFIFIFLVAIFLIRILFKIIRKMFPKKLKGGNEQMAKPKKVKTKPEAIDELEDDYLKDLDDDGGDMEEETEEESQDLESDKLKDLEMKIETYEKAITTNQKYIKKIWDKVKELEENFRLLYERK